MLNQKTSFFVIFSSSSFLLGLYVSKCPIELDAVGRADGEFRAFFLVVVFLGLGLYENCLTDDLLLGEFFTLFFGEFLTLFFGEEF